MILMHVLLIVQIKPEIIEIITWNDYGESHYIADLNSNINIGNATYVNGQDHSPWRKIAQYYISWYKSGTQPTIAVCNWLNHPCLYCLLIHATLRMTR